MCVKYSTFLFWEECHLSVSKIIHYVVILSGAQSAEPKDLRTEFTYAVNKMPRSFDSLRSLRMTAWGSLCCYKR